jgi:hypothetical protein
MQIIENFPPTIPPTSMVYYQTIRRSIRTATLALIASIFVNQIAEFVEKKLSDNFTQLINKASSAICLIIDTKPI